VTARRAAFAASAWLYAIGVIVQVFLAGAALFELTDWSVHTDLGWGLGSAPLIVLVLALVARADRRTVWLVVALLVLGFIQPALAEAREMAPVVAAVHPVNALVLFWLAVVVARRSTHAARGAPERP
jgi:hypothetical protein